jgi:hypothetical protein
MVNKGEIFTVHTILYGGKEVQLHSILTLELEGSEQSALYPSCFTIAERLPYPLIPTE